MMRIPQLNMVFFLAVLAAVSVAAYTLFAPYAGSIFFAAVLAILFHGPYRRLTALLGGRARLSATLMLLLVAVTIILPLSVAATVIVGEAADAVQNISVNRSVVTAVQDRINGYGALIPGYMTTDGRVSPETIGNMARQVGSVAVTVAQKTYQGAVGSVIGIFVLFFTLFFFLTDGERMMTRLMYLSPLADRHEKMLFHQFASMTRATIKGTLIIGLVQGSIGAGFFWFAGIPNIAIWWMVMVLLAVIPMLGAGVVGFPVAAYCLLTGDVTAAVVLLAGFLLISVVDNYLRPVLVGRDAQMHTLLVFFATLGGITVFGLVGFIVGPVVMALFVALWDIYAAEFSKELNEYNA